MVNFDLPSILNFCSSLWYFWNVVVAQCNVRDYWTLQKIPSPFITLLFKDKLYDAQGFWNYLAIYLHKIFKYGGMAAITFKRMLLTITKTKTLTLFLYQNSRTNNQWLLCKKTMWFICWNLPACLERIITVVLTYIWCKNSSLLQEYC